MGSERDDEDPHRGRGSTPKLRLAGRIDGVVDGRPVSLIAERQNLVLTVERWRTLLTIGVSLFRRKNCGMSGNWSRCPPLRFPGVTASQPL